MSTKIYNAFRTKPRMKLWPLVGVLRAQVEMNIRKVLKHELAHIGGAPFEAYYDILKNFKEQYVRAERHPYGMDVSLSIREHRSRYYLIPYANGMMRDVWKFLERNKQLEDFHYQDSTDKSAKCSDAAWARRKWIWGELGSHVVGTESQWWDFLSLEVLTPNTLYRIIYPLIYKKQ